MVGITMSRSEASEGSVEGACAPLAVGGGGGGGGGMMFGGREKESV